MQFTTIELKNFRQFKELSLNFSVDAEKKVTVVIGDNGAGKSTLMKAFVWGLYGDKLYEDSLINKEVQECIVGDKIEEVLVILEFIHLGKKYRLIRSAHYNRYTEVSTSFQIMTADERGECRTYPNEMAKAMLKKIFPHEMSPYFFLDGESIDGIKKNMRRRAKENPLNQAVQNLLGLQDIEKLIWLIEHNNGGIIKDYDERLRRMGNSALGSLLKNKNDLVVMIQKNMEEIEKRQDRIASIQSEQDDLQKELESNKHYTDCQDKIKTTEETIEENKNKLKNNCRDLINEFFVKTHDDIIFSLTYKFLDEVKERDLDAANIPGLCADTIDRIIKNGKCICGCNIEIGSSEYKALKALLDYIPPKTNSMLINELRDRFYESFNEEKLIFGDELREEKDNSSIEGWDRTEWIKQKIEKNQKPLNKMHEALESKIALVHELEGLVEFNGDKAKDAYVNNKEKIDFLREKINNLSGKNDALKEQLEECERKISTLSRVDKESKEIDCCKNVAQIIYKRLKSKYEAKELEIKDNLEKRLNTYFARLFNSNLKLKIGTYYEITLKGGDENPDDREILGSTGQNITIILSFILAVLSLMQESFSKDGSNLIADHALVLDAPFSELDPKRKKGISQRLTEHVSQLLIFTKDEEDVSLFRESLANVYVLKKREISFHGETVESAFDTYIEEGTLK